MLAMTPNPVMTPDKRRPRLLHVPNAGSTLSDRPSSRYGPGHTKEWPVLRGTGLHPTVAGRSVLGVLLESPGLEFLAPPGFAHRHRHDTCDGHRGDRRQRKGQLRRRLTDRTEGRALTVENDEPRRPGPGEADPARTVAAEHCRAAHPASHGADEPHPGYGHDRGPPVGHRGTEHRRGSRTLSDAVDEAAEHGQRGAGLVGHGRSFPEHGEPLSRYSRNLALWR